MLAYGICSGRGRTLRASATAFPKRSERDGRPVAASCLQIGRFLSVRTEFWHPTGPMVAAAPSTRRRSSSTASTGTAPPTTPCPTSRWVSVR